MRDSKYLLPDNQETIKATEVLAKEGFVVMPYMYPDLNVARDLVNAGAASIMPLGAPIGTNKGLATREFIKILIDEIDLPVIVDAGIGRPVAGVRGHGDGRGGSYGEHRHRHRGRHPGHGRGLQKGDRGRPHGVPRRPGPRARDRRGILAADRFPARLRRSRIAPAAGWAAKWKKG